MKTVLVRIRVDQAKKLNDFAELLGTRGINSFVQRGVDLLLEQEVPAYVAAMREVRRKLNRKERQAVTEEGVSVS